MKYGEKDGAVGYLVGEENRGLNVMFIMMNAARLAVGMQGVAVAERATQHALAYAKERRQGRSMSTKSGMSPIIEHADIRRNLMTMKALTQAARAICLVTAKETDVSRRAKDVAERAAAAHRVALLTPIAKAFSTDIGCEVASIGVQIHGGMGFIEETGAAQHYRDARILPIYEGTNGIQAIDLVTRKLPLEGGKVVEAYIGELKGVVDEVRASNRPEFGRMGERLGEAVAASGRGEPLDGRRPAEEPRGSSRRRRALSAPVRPGRRRHLPRQGCAGSRPQRLWRVTRPADRHRPLLRREPRHRRPRLEGHRGQRRRLHARHHTRRVVGLKWARSVMASGVVATLHSDDAHRCVKIIKQPDGRFGFQEFRREPEDAGGWTLVNDSPTANLASKEQALEAACAGVAWLRERDVSLSPLAGRGSG